MTTEMDDRPDEPVPDEPAPERPVATFEGEPVVEMEGKLPAILLEMAEGYPRGTHLRMMVEVRVRNVGYNENRKGELVRQHTFALEEVQLVAAFNPEDVRDDVGGSASAHPTQTPEEASELGLEIGRTSSLWGQGDSSAVGF